MPRGETPGASTITARWKAKTTLRLGDGGQLSQTEHVRTPLGLLRTRLLLVGPGRRTPPSAEQKVPVRYQALPYVHPFARPFPRLACHAGLRLDSQHPISCLPKPLAPYLQVANDRRRGTGKSPPVYELTYSHRLHGWLVPESVSVSYGKATSYLPVIDSLKGYFKIA